MKNILSLFVFCFFASQCLAQLGVSAGYKTFNPTGWNAIFRDNFNEEPYPMPGWQFGLDYWFRLKKRRIEFAPEITVARFQKKNQVGEIEHRVLGLHFNSAVYIFDLASDCNCPTFSKDGNFFSKGFFLEVSPGVVHSYNIQKLNSPVFVNSDGTKWTLGGSVGAGLDFGFSDLFTLTPIVRYHFYPNTDWGQPDWLGNSPFKTDLSQLFLGLRLRLHFKEFAKARYR